MKLSRRHFVGASVIAATGLVNSTLLATPIEPTLSKVAAQPKLANPPDMIEQAIAALDRHATRIARRDIVAIADYSLHSRENRFHLADVEGGRIMRSFLVSHGKGSDRSNSGLLQRFSNRPGSNASSRGSFLTGETYYGKHGQSRRLHGLEEDNDRAFDRAIVIHGADYVDRSMAQRDGRVGRSLGCFAFERSEIADVLDLLGPGRLLFSAK